MGQHPDPAREPDARGPAIPNPMGGKGRGNGGGGPPGQGERRNKQRGNGGNAKAGDGGDGGDGKAGADGGDAVATGAKPRRRYAAPPTTSTTIAVRNPSRKRVMSPFYA